MKKIIIAGMSIFLLASTASAKECGYCDKISSLKAEFSKVKPEPMNEDTIDQQDELVGEAEALIKAIVKKRTSDKDLERVVGLLAVALPFDYAESLGESLYADFKPFSSRLDKEVRRQQKAGVLTAEQADQILTSLAIGENTVEHGTDR